MLPDVSNVAVVELETEASTLCCMSTDFGGVTAYTHLVLKQGTGRLGPAAKRHHLISLTHFKSASKPLIEQVSGSRGFCLAGRPRSAMPREPYA